MYHLSLNHCGCDTSMPGLASLFLTSLSQGRCDDVLNLSSSLYCHGVELTYGVSSSVAQIIYPLHPHGNKHVIQ